MEQCNTFAVKPFLFSAQQSTPMYFGSWAACLGTSAVLRYWPKKLYPKCYRTIKHLFAVDTHLALLQDRGVETDLPILTTTRRNITIKLCGKCGHLVVVFRPSECWHISGLIMVNAPHGFWNNQCADYLIIQRADSTLYVEMMNSGFKQWEILDLGR
jgi:hypothetical protein